MSSPLPPTKYPGYLIAFEGVDGTGKSTQARLAAEKLSSLGHETLQLKEPTDGPIGSQIRAVMGGNGPRPSPREEFDLFLRDRQQNVEENILPALKRGAIVLIDRYYISSMVYQGVRGLDPEFIRIENEKIAPRPDLTLFLNLPLEESLHRLQRRNRGRKPVNPFEIHNYQRKVYDLFQTIQVPGMVRVEAQGSAEELHSKLMALITQTLSEGDS